MSCPSRVTHETSSSAAPGGKAQDADACCFGESLLLVIEVQQGVGSDFDGVGLVKAFGK